METDRPGKMPGECICHQLYYYGSWIGYSQVNDNVQIQISIVRQMTRNHQTQDTHQWISFRKGGETGAFTIRSDPDPENSLPYSLYRYMIITATRKRYQEEGP